MLTASQVTPQVDVLVLCPELEAGRYRAPLAESCRIAVTSSRDAAVQYLARATPSVVVIDGDVEEAGAGVYEVAKSAAAPPALLVTLSTPEAAGAVIDKCDSILLKPFAPNLLSARVGRLLRSRSQQVRVHSAILLARAEQVRAKSTHLMHRQSATTNVEWPNDHCPHCDHTGVILFDYASLRRAWYACPACRKAWLAKRRE
jgi:hypothetical protein